MFIYWNIPIISNSYYFSIVAYCDFNSCYYKFNMQAVSIYVPEKNILYSEELNYLFPFCFLLSFPFATYPCTSKKNNNNNKKTPTNRQTTLNTRMF